MKDKNVDDPKQIIENATIFSKDLNMDVVPKHVALLALEMSKLDKAFDVLSDSMNLLSKLDKDLN